MSNLPVSHRYSIIAALAALLAYAGLHLWLLRPAGEEAGQAAAAVEQKQKMLAKKGWKLDHDRLVRMLDDQRRRDHNLSQRQEALISRTTTGFDSRLAPVYGTRANFLSHVSRLDYQEEYHRIRQELQGRGAKLDPAALGLAENTVAPSTSQLVLQLWTVETVVEAVLDAGLKVAKDGAAAMVSAQPVQALFAAPPPAAPMLLKLGVVLTVEGSAAELSGFLLGAAAAERFFTVDNLELARLPEAPTTDGPDQVLATMRCSMFFLLNDNPAAIMPAVEVLEKLPPGA